MSSGPRPAAAIASAALLAVLSGCGSAPAKKDTTPSFFVSQVPAAIAVPTGNQLAFQFRASGVQHYECRAKGGDAGPAWVLLFPEATLYDRTGTTAGRLYAGPTWEYGDDSKTTGKVLAEAPSPREGNLPWQLLEAKPGPRTGAMSGVTYVQRAKTDGGVAPSDPCSTATIGARKRVDFEADFLFYTR